MDSSLDSILSDKPAEEHAPQQAAQVAEPEQQVEQGTGEDTGTPPEETKDDPLEKHRKGLEAAAAAERKKRQDAEAREAAARHELEAFRQQVLAQRQAPPQQVRPQDDGKPLRSQFQTEDEWLDARDAWRDAQRQREQAERQEQEQQRALAERTQGIVAQAAALDGFDLNAFARTPITTPMAEAILDSEQAAQLVHYLTANQAEAQRIAALSPARQVKELARIEDRLAQPPEQQEPEAPKPTVRLPQTLTTTRDARGQFASRGGYSGPTPLNAILK
jgi:hypothetical protein